MKWYQIYVKVPEGNGYSNPRMAKRIDEHISSVSVASFVAPSGTPIKNENMEYEVRCFAEQSVNLVKFILTTHYGLEISNVVENE